jgi:hypothetical protein
MDSWLSGPSKSFVPFGAMVLIGCGRRVPGEWPDSQPLLMRLREWFMGGYRNRLITSYAETSVVAASNACRVCCDLGLRILLMVKVPEWPEEDLWQDK